MKIKVKKYWIFYGQGDYTPFRQVCYQKTLKRHLVSLKKKFGNVMVTDDKFSFEPKFVWDVEKTLKELGVSF